MSRRFLTSSGVVVMVAAVVTAVALLISGSSGSPRSASEHLPAGGGAVASVVGTSRTDRYESNPASRNPASRNPASRNPASLRITRAQMRRQGRLISQECGLGAGGHRTASAPLAQTTLSSTHGGETAYLYLIGRNEVICTQNALAGDSVGGPQQAPAVPAGASIAIAGVSAGEKRGQTATLEYGRAGKSVRSITFVLARGERVPAVVRAGWFLIWWPSSQSPVTAQLTTTAGTRTVTLGAAAASPATACPRPSACFSTSSPGHVVNAIGPRHSKHVIRVTLKQLGPA